MSKRQSKIGTRTPGVSLPPESYLDGAAPPKEVDFAELCRRIIADTRSTGVERLRAADMLRNLEGDSPLSLRDELAGRSDDEIERELAHYLNGVVEQRVHAEVDRRIKEWASRLPPTPPRTPAGLPQSPAAIPQVPPEPTREAVSDLEGEPADPGTIERGLERQLGMEPGWQLERGWDQP